MNKEPPEPQPHLWDGTPMAAMPYVISKAGDMPTHHDEPLLERYQREHREFEGMNMSKAEELAEYCEGLAVDIDYSHFTDDLIESASELRRLSAINAELIEALKGLDEAYCRAGSPLSKDERTEDRKRLIAARAAIAKAQGEQP